MILARSPGPGTLHRVEHRLTVWYSTPSIFHAPLQFGNLTLGARRTCGSCCLPAKCFRSSISVISKGDWPQPVYFNLYGPTETTTCLHVCPDSGAVPDDREVPYPIGFACAHCATLVLDEEGREVAAGDEGLLHINGPSVFGGLLESSRRECGGISRARTGVQWYNTGNLVRWDNAAGLSSRPEGPHGQATQAIASSSARSKRALYSTRTSQEVGRDFGPRSDAGVKIVAFLVSRA